MHESESELAQSCLTLRDPWTVVYQALLSMGFSRQEYWSGLPCPSPQNLFNKHLYVQFFDNSGNDDLVPALEELTV